MTGEDEKKTDLVDFFSRAEKIKESIDYSVENIKKRMTELEEMEMFSNYNKEYLSDFFKKPYVIIPKKEEEWYLAVPKFFDINIGYLTKSTDSYNVFIVNKYADYLGNVPSEFAKIFKFKPKLPLKVLDGVVLTGQLNQDRTWDRYKKYLSARSGKDRIKIKQGKQFDFLAKLIDDGILPFVPKPVENSHYRKAVWKIDNEEVEKRRNMDFFKDAIKRFLDTGAVGVYWAMGTGKTIFGCELLSMINVDGKPNLVISGNSATLREQWKERLESVELASDTEVHTYHAIHKVKNREWGMIIFDECHHLPANTFSKMATIKTEYRVGLSATPYREDGRTDYIFALTGFPIGLNWKVLLELGLIKAPKVTLFICKDIMSKNRKIKELLNDPMKTLIYSFGISEGKRLSKFLGIPFVYGSTPISQRREIIENSESVIVSSVGKEGISLSDIQRTMTYDFHFGSRQEETQFFGRLLHGEDEGYHYIFMTDKEFEKYGKRLYGIQEKGFKIRVQRI